MARRDRSSHDFVRAEVPLDQDIAIATGSARLTRETDGSVRVDVNNVPSSLLDPDPLHLGFEYQRWMQIVISEHLEAMQERAEEQDSPTAQCAHLGGAGCALPRALLAQFPDSRHTVVEIDGELALGVRAWFDLPRSPHLRIRVADAAEALSTWRDARFDVVVRDVFAGIITPPSLTGLDAAQHASRVLRPGGIYVANCAAPPGTFDLADEVRTLSEAFSHIAVIAEPAHLTGKRRGNCVLVASQHELPASIERRLRSDAVSVRVADTEQVRALASRGAVRRTACTATSQPQARAGSND